MEILLPISMQTQLFSEQMAKPRASVIAVIWIFKTRTAIRIPEVTTNISCRVNKDTIVHFTEMNLLPQYKLLGPVEAYHWKFSSASKVVGVASAWKSQLSILP